MNTTELMLADELLLLALDEKGAVHSAASTALDLSLAGALLMELALDARLDTDGAYLSVINHDPSAFPLLDDTLRLISTSKKPRSVQDWVTRLPSEISDLRHRLLDALVSRGILERREQRFLRIFPVTRYPERDTSIEDDIRERLDSVLLEGAVADERTMLLAQLIKNCDLISVLYERSQHKAVEQRIEELNAQEPYGRAITQAVANAQSAINAAIISATIASTTAATAACSTTSAGCS